MSKGDSLGGSNPLLYHGPSNTIENFLSPFARSLASFELESLIAPTIGIEREREVTLSALLRHTVPHPRCVFVITGVGPLCKQAIASYNETVDL